MELDSALWVIQRVSRTWLLEHLMEKLRGLRLEN